MHTLAAVVERLPLRLPVQHESALHRRSAGPAGSSSADATTRAPRPSARRQAEPFVQRRGHRDEVHRRLTVALTVAEPESLFARLAAASGTKRPPVSSWHPERSGSSGMRIG